MHSSFPLCNMLRPPNCQIHRRQLSSMNLVIGKPQCESKNKYCKSQPPNHFVHAKSSCMKGKVIPITQSTVQEVGNFKREKKRTSPNYKFLGGEPREAGSPYVFMTRVFASESLERDRYVQKSEKIRASTPTLQEHQTRCPSSLCHPIRKTNEMFNSLMQRPKEQKVQRK